MTAQRACSVPAVREGFLVKLNLRALCKDLKLDSRCEVAFLSVNSVTVEMWESISTQQHLVLGSHFARYCKIFISFIY